jgi:hypothetical protein
MVVVSLLTVVLSATLASVWRGLCLPALDAAARSRIAMEAGLATAALARDFGGTLPDPAGSPGGKNDGRLVGLATPSPVWLRLCYHGGGGSVLTPTWAAPDTVISYQLVGEQLVRADETAGTSVTVARSLTAFQVAPLDDGSGVAILLTFAARDISLTYQLNAIGPPAP